MAKAVLKALIISLGCAFALPASAIPPVAVTDRIPGTEDTTASGNVLTNDSATGIGNTLTLMSVTTPAAGGTIAFDGSGKVSYTPPADAAGVFSFSYVVREDDPVCVIIVPPPGGCIANGSGAFEIAPVADPPVLVVSNTNGAEGSSVPVDITATLQDLDGSQSTEETYIDGIPAGLTLSAGTDLGGGLWVVPTNSLAGLTVTGPTDFNGTLNLTVSTRTVDVAAPLPSDDLTTGGIALTVNIDPVNDQPTVVGPAPVLTTSEDVNASVSLAGVFADVDIATNADTLSYSVVSNTNPAVNIASMAGDVLSVSLFPNQFGTGDVVVRATDSGGLSADVTVSVTVNSVNDIPVVVNPIPTLVITEDDPPMAVDISNVFTDADIATNGDSLSIAVSAYPGYETLFSAFSLVGNMVNMAFAPNQNGYGVLQLLATDQSGASAISYIIVYANPVNDAPVVVGGIPDFTMSEDDPTRSVNINAFDDVDILTNGDVLSFSVTGNTNPGLFSAVVISGDMLDLTVVPDANGTSDITIRATDLGGLWVEDTFTVTVTSVNDMPIANGESDSMDEDGGQLVIPVLDNDYLAEEPTTITAVTHDGVHTVLDEADNPDERANATVVIDGTNLIYEPTKDFYGTDTFTYTITDADGDTATGTVTVTVNPLNDPPEGAVLDPYNMQENQTLTVSAAAGVLRGAYDVDGAFLDGSGNPLGSVLVAQIQTYPAVGVLNFNTDGSFDYTPPLNFDGDVIFTYNLFDNISLSTTTYTATISVNDVPVVVVIPTPGEVSVTYNLSQVPLEQSGITKPNVMLLLDDSGSMDMNLVVDGDDLDGGMLLSNADIATRSVRESAYSYLWDLDNAYPANSDFGLIAPTEEALTADGDTAGNNYGVWRLRNHLYNKLYYNPEIYYEPWEGQDEDGVEFGDADIAAIRIDPVDPDNTFPLLTLRSYDANNVPQWSTNGGTTRVDVDNLYLPFYYTTTGTEPLQASDAHTKVEILPANAPFTGGPDREDCRDDGDPTVCTYAQEIQNFANYMQYYRTREYVVKAGMGSVIAEVQDLRIGLETVSATTSINVAEMNDLHTEGDKKALLDTLYSFDSYGGTPLRQLLNRGGQILGCRTGSNCPALAPPEGNCQQNFALLFTDGYWTSGTGVTTNTDVDGPGEFDGGRYADSVSQTLADTAMHWYEEDLFPTVDDEVPISSRDIDGAPADYFDGEDFMHQHMKTYTIAFGVSGRIDPDEARNHPVSSPFTWTNPDDGMTETGWTDPFDGSLEKVDDVLHAAMNGRGEFLSAGNPQELQAAVESAFLEFSQAAGSASAAAFNSTSLREGTLLYRGFYDLRDRTGELTATQVSTDGTLASVPEWIASDALDLKAPNDRVIVTWDGSGGDAFRYSDLTASQQVTLDADQVDYLRGVRTAEQPTGDLRERPATNGMLGPIINSSPVFVGTPRAINRDQSPFPTTSLYSDFVNSVSGRTPMVYVGANDGMLHGFEGTTGEELFSFVPNKILDSSADYSNKLNDFTSPFYFHNYYVDLSPRLNDVFMRPAVGQSKQWMTVLLGGLGAGGKGFFALNVTNPDAAYTSEANASATVLWEFTDEDDTYPLDVNGAYYGGADGAITDPDGLPVKDLGYALTPPVVTMTNEDDGSGVNPEKEWAAIFGNGPNSTSGIATLFVLFLDRGLDGWSSGDFTKITTGYGVALPGEQQAGYPNALGAPAAVDADLNGTVDYVYAGDRLGNLFRFDMTSDNPADWHAVHLFQATYNDGVTDVIQPIQSAPLVIKNPNGLGFVVIFGTGSFISKDDAGNEEIQSIYAIWDRLDNNPATSNSNTKTDRLVEQTITNVVDDSLTPAVTRRIVSSNPVELVADGAGPGVYGWYIDLDMPRAISTISGQANDDTSGNAPPDPQFPGEKAIRRIIFRDGALVTTTVLPATDETSCFGARPGAILVMDAYTGGDAGAAVIDFNTDGYIDEDDLLEVGGESFSGGLLFNQSDLDGALVDLSTLGGEGDTDFLFVSGGNETISYRIRDLNAGRTGRLSWIELDDAN